MSVKLKGLSVCLLLLAAACGSVKPSTASLKMKFRVAMKDMAANQVYLGDIVNAAADEVTNPDEAIGDDVVIDDGEEVDEGINPDPEAIGDDVIKQPDVEEGEAGEEENAGEEAGNEEDPAEGEEEEENSNGGDEGTGDDTENNRVDQMVAQLFAELDIDNTDSLTVEEFLKITDVRNPERAADLSADERAELDERLTAQFERFAGQDNVLTDVELANLLRGQQGRVGDFRRKRCRGQGPQRQESAEQMLRRFDTNGDGVIDLAELQAMIDANAQNAGRRGRRN